MTELYLLAVLSNKEEGIVTHQDILATPQDRGLQNKCARASKFVLLGLAMPPATMRSWPWCAATAATALLTAKSASIFTQTCSSQRSCSRSLAGDRIVKMPAGTTPFGPSLKLC
jgi:hypothetical protein